MQTEQNEGGSCPGSGQAETAGRLDQDSRQVELRGGGWPGVIAHCRTLLYDSAQPQSDLEGLVIRIPELMLSQAAALLITQGMPLQDFFPPDVHFSAPPEPTKIDGPFLLLQGRLSDLWDPPPRLKDVVLVKVRSAPDTISRNELLAAFLALV